MLRLFAMLSLSAVLLAACGGGDSEPDAAERPAAAPQQTVTPTPEPGLARGPVGNGGTLRSSDGKLELRSGGRTGLDVSVKEMAANALDAPKGWKFVTPVYDITARDGERAVTRLNDAIEISFRVSGSATVMYHTGKEWVIVESEADGKGTVTAKTDHLTPYAAARPTGSENPVARLKATATASPAAVRPSVTAPPAPSRTPDAAGTGTAAPGSTTPNASSAAPTATATPSAVPTNPEDALRQAVQKFKNKQVKITSAQQYNGTGTVPLPPTVETAIASVAAQSEVFYGIYNGVNEAITAGATLGGSAAGTFSLLVEPKTTFPASTTDAQAQLAEFFPGAIGPRYSTSVANATTYTYYAVSGATMYVMGYVQYQGLPIAYLVVGTGAYYGYAFSTGTIQ